MAKTFVIRTLGCQMNVHDSEIISDLLQKSGYKEFDKEFDPPQQKISTQKAQSSSYPSIIIFNTCAVRENAKKRLLGLLGILAHLKRANPNFKIVVAGCLAQNDREQLLKESRLVDIVVGTYNLHSIPKLLDLALNTNQKQIEVLDEFPKNDGFIDALPKSKHQGFVSVAMGCNQKCSFCIVPLVRGPLVNRNFEDIINECKNHIKSGRKEIMLLGQNVNSFRSKDGNFDKLLDKIASIKGLERLRFMSPHPAFFTKSVIEVMSKHKNIMPCIHMPLQSGSTQLLKKMNRGYTFDHFKKLLQNIREKVKNVEITTDIIVGFVGESDEDFEATINAIKELEFLSVFSFIYSPRPGTPSLKMGDTLSKDIIQKRFDRLLEIQNEITLKRMKQFEGKTKKVLIDYTLGKRDDKTKRISGRDEHALMVHIDNIDEKNKPKDGEIVDVKITYSAPFHLIGEIEK